MKVFFALIHSLRSHQVDVEVLFDKVIDKNPRYLVVKHLLRFTINISELMMHLGKNSKCFLINIAVKEILDHTLIVVVSLHRERLWTALLLKQFSDDSLRLPFFLNKGYYQSNNIRNDVPILYLLHCALFFVWRTIRMIFLVFSNLFFILSS